MLDLWVRLPSDRLQRIGNGFRAIEADRHDADLHETLCVDAAVPPPGRSLNLSLTWLNRFHRQRNICTMLWR